jgi:hypothetical protein
MNVEADSGGQIEATPQLKTFDMFENMPGVRLERRLPQPAKLRQAAAFLLRQQMIEPTQVIGSQPTR